MHKVAITRAKDPKQESLREEKRKWNSKVSAFIDDLINAKRWLNGHDNKFYAQKSKITELIPNDPASVIRILMTDFAQLGQEGLDIINHQKIYSEERLIRKSQETYQMQKNASNTLSRALSHLKGPILFGSKEAKFSNKYRLQFLKVLADLKDKIRDIQTDVLFKPLSKYPDIGSDYEQLQLKAKQFNSIQKTYKELMSPQDSSGESNYQIIKEVKLIQKELEFISSLPYFPVRTTNQLSRRVKAFLQKVDVDSSILSKQKDTKIEKNLIKHDFRDLKKDVIKTWQLVFPDSYIYSFSDIQKILESNSLSEDDIRERLIASTKDNPVVIEQERKNILRTIQEDLVFVSMLPTYLHQPTKRLVTAVENTLSKIESSRTSKNTIDIEINQISLQYSTLVEQTRELWSKILLENIHISSFKDIYEKYKESGLNPSEVIDRSGGYPHISEDKDINEKFARIVGTKVLDSQSERNGGDGIYLISFYKEYVESNKLNIFDKFPETEYLKLVNVIDTAKDAIGINHFIKKDIVRLYTNILLYVNNVLIENNIIDHSYGSFLQLKHAVDKKEDLVASANFIYYNIAKRIGELKNKINLGDKNSVIKLTISEIFSEAVNMINGYMNILEETMLDQYQFESLNNDLEKFFQRAKNPMNALETAYRLSIYDDSDTDSGSEYKKNMKKVLRKKDETSLKKGL